MSGESLDDLQSGLSIIALSKSITAEDIFNNDNKIRASGSSAEVSTNFTPQQLAADLASYQVYD